MYHVTKRICKYLFVYDEYTAFRIRTTNRNIFPFELLFKAVSTFYGNSADIRYSVQLMQQFCGGKPRTRYHYAQVGIRTVFDLFNCKSDCETGYYFISQRYDVFAYPFTVPFAAEVYWKKSEYVHSVP